MLTMKLLSLFSDVLWEHVDLLDWNDVTWITVEKLTFQIRSRLLDTMTVIFWDFLCLALRNVGHTALLDQCAFATIYYNFLQSLNFVLLLFITFLKTHRQWKAVCLSHTLLFWLVTSIIVMGLPDGITSCPDALQRLSATSPILPEIWLYATANCCRFQQVWRHLVSESQAGCMTVKVTNFLCQRSPAAS